jgi:hypothetical protein
MLYWTLYHIIIFQVDIMIFQERIHGDVANAVKITMS